LLFTRQAVHRGQQIIHWNIDTAPGIAKMVLVRPQAEGICSRTSSSKMTSDRQYRYRRPLLIGFAAAVAVVAIAGCAPSVDHRGYLPQKAQLQQLQIGMPKPEVEALLGSPSTTATVNMTGDSYYYISSVVEQRAFFEPQEVDRKVLAVRFDQLDQVQSFAQYGLEDGQVVNISDRRTPTRGKELTILQQMFSNIGRFSGPGG
jgi:outer membrane protein assembly factor BamE (lipoprotein component of BamABCDE complex)